jgi:hypothetical protein
MSRNATRLATQGVSLELVDEGPAFTPGDSLSVFRNVIKHLRPRSWACEVSIRPGQVQRTLLVHRRIAVQLTRTGALDVRVSTPY